MTRRWPGAEGKPSSAGRTWPLISAPLCADHQTPADTAGGKITGEPVTADGAVLCRHKGLH